MQLIRKVRAVLVSIALADAAVVQRSHGGNETVAFGRAVETGIIVGDIATAAPAATSSVPPVESIGISARRLDRTIPSLLEKIDLAGAAPGITIRVFNSLSHAVVTTITGSDVIKTIPPVHAQDYTLPIGWHGMAAYAMASLSDKALIDQGTKWEVAVGLQQLHYDVSLVDGFTVPMVCSCQGRTAAGNWPTEFAVGCNVDLFKYHGCPTDGGNQLCRNPQTKKSATLGPADAFFAPCSGASYTFPQDHGAETSCASTSTIFCCIGDECPRSLKQMSRPAVE